MTWKPWITWCLVLPTWAAIAYLSSDNWITRVILFAALTGPTIFWVRHKLRQNGA